MAYSWLRNGVHGSAPNIDDVIIKSGLGYFTPTLESRKQADQFSPNFFSFWEPYGGYSLPFLPEVSVSEGSNCGVAGGKVAKNGIGGRGWIIFNISLKVCASSLYSYDSLIQRGKLEWV